MSILSRFTHWIDIGYRRPLETSNYMMGIILAVIGIVGISLGGVFYYLSGGFALIVIAIFGWRFIAISRQQIRNYYDKKNRNG